jgi:hypothetical protein
MEREHKVYAYCKKCPCNLPATLYAQASIFWISSPTTTIIVAHSIDELNSMNGLHDAGRGQSLRLALNWTMVGNTLKCNLKVQILKTMSSAEKKIERNWMLLPTNEVSIFKIFCLGHLYCELTSIPPKPTSSWTGLQHFPSIPFVNSKN